MNKKEAILILNAPCFSDKSNDIQELATLFQFDCLFIDRLDDVSHVKAVLLSDEMIDKTSHIKELFPEVTIILVTSIATSFSIKNQFQIDFILDIPLDMQEVAAIFRLLTEKNEEDIDIPPELLIKYESTIHQKVDNIISLATSLQDLKTLDAVSNFKKEVHKIAGSSSAYGYRQVGELCKSFELFLAEMIGENPSTEKIGEIVERLPSFLRKFKLFFQKIYPTNVGNQERTSPSLHDDEDKGIEETDQVYNEREIESTVLLITSDIVLTGFFQEKFSNDEIEIRVFSIPGEALEWINKTQTLPKCVVVESFYPELRMSGDQLIEPLRKKDLDKRCIFTMILDEDELKNRIDALEQGFHFTIRRHLPEEHLESLNRALEYRQQKIKVRILLVDDDPDMNTVVSTTLKKMGMVIECLTDETKILEVLDSFKPDVLLLDLGLTKYDGLNLLKTIRMDINNQEMIIIIFTGNHSEKTAIEVYDAGADEIIFKPFHSKLVTSRIMNIMRRYHHFGIKRASDKSTSMLNQREFYQSFDETYNMTTKNGMQVSLILLQIDNYSVAIAQFGIHLLDEITFSFAHALRQFFKSAQVLGHFGEGRFGLIIERLTGGEIEYLLSRFRDYIWHNLPLLGKEGHKINFSSGICILRVGDETTNDAIREAENALSKAINLGPGGIELIRLKKEWKGERVEDEVVIINKDKSISDFLTYGFKKQGIIVKQIPSGSEAKNYFLNLNSMSHNSVVIMEHPLPDLENTELIQMISIKFSNRIPILCLSSLCDEDEIVKILNAGAHDIILKPFSVKVLLNKSLRLLYGGS